MRKLTISESAIIICITMGTFLFGLYLGNHNAEQNLYSIFCKIGTEARRGNVPARAVCNGLFEVKGMVNDNITSRYMYWVLDIYGKDK